MPSLITPTSGVVMGRVSYGRWLRFMWPLLLMLMLIALVTVVLNLGATQLTVGSSLLRA